MNGLNVSLENAVGGCSIQFCENPIEGCAGAAGGGEGYPRGFAVYGHFVRSLIECSEGRRVRREELCWRLCCGY